MSWNVIKEVEIELAKRQWKASDFVKAARAMGYHIDETRVSQWRSGKNHPNSKSRHSIREVFAAHPPVED